MYTSTGRLRSAGSIVSRPRITADSSAMLFVPSPRYSESLRGLATVDDHDAEAGGAGVAGARAVGPHVDRVRGGGLRRRCCALGCGVLADDEVDRLAAERGQVARAGVIDLRAIGGLVDDGDAAIGLLDERAGSVDVCPYIGVT